MSQDSPELIPFKRSRFQTRLPKGRLYTASHYWLAETEPGIWRVGLTRFATRMLGEIVESGMEVRPGDPVSVGQTVGWIEGFKARSDVYCSLEGAFIGGNPELETSPHLTDKDPYFSGWIYQARGAPDANALSPEAYIQVLNATIDKMTGTAATES